VLSEEFLKATAVAGAYLPAMPVWEKSDVGRRLAWAGYPTNIDPETFRGLKRLAGISAMIILPAVLPFWMALMSAIPGYYLATFLPELWLDSAVSVKIKEIDNELPHFVDILTVAVSAGVPIHAALPEAAKECRGALAGELAMLMGALTVGTSRCQALSDLASSTPSKELKRFAILLADAERFGSPITHTLRAFAAQLREKRLYAIRAEAQKLPIKMLFPLVFLILPAFLLLTAGPLIITLL
jgi:tight adherence protein C